MNHDGGFKNEREEIPHTLGLVISIASPITSAAASFVTKKESSPKQAALESVGRNVGTPSPSTSSSSVAEEVDELEVLLDLTTPLCSLLSLCLIVEIQPRPSSPPPIRFKATVGRLSLEKP